MSQANQSLESLAELLKTSPEKLDKGTIENLQRRRKELADKFFDRNVSREEKIKIQDELAMLHEFFKYKPINKIGTGKNAPRPITREERAQNCEDFKAYMKKIDVWNMLGPDDQVRALAQVWGGPRG